MINNEKRITKSIYAFFVILITMMSPSMKSREASARCIFYITLINKQALSERGAEIISETLFDPVIICKALCGINVA